MNAFPSIDTVIERSFDPAFFNRVCNLPGVREWLAPGDAPIDVSELVLNPLNFALKGKRGGFILVNVGRGAYCVHSQFEPHSGEAVGAMRAGFAYMFSRTDCVRVTSLVPDNNKAAKALAKLAGFRPWYRREKSPFGPCEMVSLTIDEWVCDDKEGALEAEGHAFHETLERAKWGAGSKLETHEDDPVHDRYVGATALMCRHGQAAKGVGVYNSWAVASGYAPIKLITDNPPVVDVVDGIAGLNTLGNMEVLLCR